MLAQNITDPWLLIGDFNYIAKSSEQKGNAEVDIQKCDEFMRWINYLYSYGPWSGWVLFYVVGPKW